MELMVILEPYHKEYNLEYLKNTLTKDKSIEKHRAIDDVVDTINIIKYFLGKKKIAVPKIEDNTMNFYYINSLNDLKPGYFNILEPATNLKVETFTNTTCIVPAICYDSNNYRVGYGKGFYDKFLTNKNIYTIGISYKETLINKIPIDKYDINLNEVISPF